MPHRTPCWTCTILGLTLLAASIVTAQPAGDRFHHTESTTPVPYDSLFAESIPLSASGDARQAYTDWFKQYGGRDHIEDLNTLQLIFGRESTAAGNSDIVKCYERGRLHSFEQGADRRILVGYDVWAMNGPHQEKKDGTRYVSELFSYIVMGLPGSLLNEQFEELRYGAGPVPDLDYFYADKPDSLLLMVGLDKETRIIKSVTGLVRIQDSRIIYRNDFSDHQEVDGYLLPGKIEFFSLGMKMDEVNLLSAVVNKPHAGSVFSPDKD